MIGGHDIIIKHNCKNDIQEVKNAIEHIWKDVVYEDASTDFSEKNDFFAYENSDAKKAWDESYDTLPEHNMVYALFRENETTLVTDDPYHEVTSKIINLVKEKLGGEIEKGCY